MQTLWQLWQQTARRHPAKPLVIEDGAARAWTATELTRAALAAAGQLGRELRGAAIAFCLPNSAAWFVRFLAIQHGRALAIPLDPATTGDARQHAARALGADFLWRDDALLPVGTTTCGRRKGCCIKVTSGTTGNLKPVACAARHLIADGRQVCRAMGIRPADRNLALIPLGHSYGLGNLVMPLLMQGTAVVCAGAVLPHYLLKLIEQHRVTVLPTVPAVLRALAETRGRARPRSLRLVISAGAPLAPEIAQRFHARFGLKIHNFYGASETGGICYDRTGNATLAGRSVGKPLAGVTVRLRRDRRVVVQSRAVAAPRGRFVLADLGEWTRHGELRLLGRHGQLANIGGRKVAPAEIERCLRALPGVSDAWVIVRKDARGRDWLAAAVETRRRREELETELARQLPAWKLPRRYHIAPALPRTDRGKLDTAALARLFANA
jgi:long-chain acyl-CoA synthetase